MSSKQRGFTIPELLVAMAIATIILVGIIGILVNLTANSSQIISTSEQIRNNQSALSAIQADIPLTYSFLATNSVADSESSASPISAGWQLQGQDENHRILILRTYATTAAPQDSDRRIVYFDETPSPCAIGGIGRRPVTNNIIYFVKNSTLYRRILVEPTPSAPYCAGQTIGQRRTCTTPNGTTCRERDVVIATNVSRFSVQYFAEPTDQTAQDDIYTSTIEAADSMAQSIPSIRVDIQTTTSSPDDEPALNSYRKMTKGNSRAL